MPAATARSGSTPPPARPHGQGFRWAIRRPASSARPAPPFPPPPTAVELLRADSGKLNLGAAPGLHGLEVTTPANAVNRPEMLGAATGSPASVGWRASGTDANISAVAGQPKGTGALLAQFPDNAATGGSARGANAVDLQTSRSANTQVASGANATLLGGSSNTASGQESVIGGGSANAASGTRAGIGGGSFNTASGVNAFVGGGARNTASGSSSWVPGGVYGTDRGHYGRGAWAANFFATAGDAQSGEFVLRRITTDATATRLTSENAAQSSSNTVNLPNSGTYMLRLLVTAQQTGGSAGTAGDCAGWELTGLIKRGANAAATVLVGSSGSSLAPLYNDTAAAAWRIGLTADTTNGGLAVSATGEANKTIRWVVRILSVETTA